MELKKFDRYKRIKQKIYVLYVDGYTEGIFTTKKEFEQRVKENQKMSMFCNGIVYEWDKLRQCYVCEDIKIMQ